MSTKAVVEPELESEPDTPRDVHGRPHFFSPLSRRWAFALPVLQVRPLSFCRAPQGVGWLPLSHSLGLPWAPRARAPPLPPAAVTRY